MIFAKPLVGSSSIRRRSDGDVDEKEAGQCRRLSSTAAIAKRTTDDDERTYRAAGCRLRSAWVLGATHMINSNESGFDEQP